MPGMIIGERLRSIRESKNLSQGDIEKRTGLLRCYTSRVENGHTVPAIETLEKYARALELPLYQLMFDGDKPPAPPPPMKTQADEKLFGARGKEARYLNKIVRSLAKLSDHDRNLLMFMAQKTARRK